MDSILFNTHDMVQVMTAVLCCLFGFVVLVSGKFKPISAMLLAGFMVAQALIASHELILYAEQFRYEVLNLSPNLFFIGSFAYAIDGPLLYLYANSLIRKDFRVRASHRLHILPLLGYSVFLVFAYYIQEQSTKSQIINQYLFDLQWHFVTSDTLIKIIRLVYFLLALNLIKKYREQLKQSRSSIEDVDLTWLKILVLGFSAVALVGVILSFAKVLTLFVEINIVWLMFLGLTTYYATLFLVCSLLFFSALNISSVAEVKDRAEESQTAYQADPEYIERIEKIMGEQKPYLIPNINFDSLSEKLDVPPRELSATLNGHFKMNFYEFINFYRIREAKLILASKKHLDKTITDIYHHVGFNSKSVFNAFFKKDTGVTPSEFRRRCQREN
jgi:AraC-like DNA-binding protein